MTNTSLRLPETRIADVSGLVFSMTPPCVPAVGMSLSPRTLGGTKFNHPHLAKGAPAVSKEVT